MIISSKFCALNLMLLVLPFWGLAQKEYKTLNINELHNEALKVVVQYDKKLSVKIGGLVKGRHSWWPAVYYVRSIGNRIFNDKNNIPLYFDISESESTRIPFLEEYTTDPIFEMKVTYLDSLTAIIISNDKKSLEISKMFKIKNKNVYVSLLMNSEIAKQTKYTITSQDIDLLLGVIQNIEIIDLFPCKKGCGYKNGRGLLSLYGSNPD